MKSKILTTIAAAVVALTVASNSQAVPIFLGSINDGTPPSVANEVSWVNHVLAQALNTTDTHVTPDDETIIRSGNADPGSGSVSTPPAGNIKTVSDPSVVAAGFEYLIAHWGGQNQMSAVWYLGGAAFDIPDNQSGMKALYPGFGFQDSGGYSGYTVYGTSTNRIPGVPDGGTTITLLGAALSGLGLVARRFKK